MGAETKSVLDDTFTESWLSSARIRFGPAAMTPKDEAVWVASSSADSAPGDDDENDNGPILARGVEKKKARLHHNNALSPEHGQRRGKDAHEPLAALLVLPASVEGDWCENHPDYDTVVDAVADDDNGNNPGCD
jgi:hypothetical protein